MGTHPCPNPKTLKTPLNRDTDSIMVSLKPHITTDEEAFTVLVYICDAVTEYFAALSTSKAVLLQAEKVMKFMIMINKKRYIAAKILATRIERDPGPKGPGTGKVTKISVAPRERIAMGVEIARRDNCLLVKETMEEVVDTIMLKNDMPGARKIVNSVLREIIGGRIDIGKLVISKSISKSDYKCDPLQVQLAIRMKERDPSYEWGLGERIPYVIVSRDHKTLADQAEDPLWAIQHGLPLDTKYYIDKQLSGPISRIFMWLPGTSDPTYMRMLSGVEEKIRASCGNQAAIDKYEKQLDKIMEKMQGHAAQILFGPGALAAHPRPKVDAGSHGIAAFFRPVAKCTRCKVGVRVNGSLCNECQPRNARCMAIGCRKSVTLETVPGIPDNYCSTCAPIMDKCPVCERLMPLSDANQGLCDNCILGRCYSCGRDDLETHYGVCPRCKDFVANRKAGMAACKVVDIEDLRRQAAEAKQECFTRCGVSTDEINCVSRECSTLLKRATLAAKIENMEKK